MTPPERDLSYVSFQCLQAFLSRLFWPTMEKSRKPYWTLPSKLVDEIDIAYFEARAGGMTGSKQDFVAELLRLALGLEAIQELRSSATRVPDAQAG